MKISVRFYNFTILLITVSEVIIFLITLYVEITVRYYNTVLLVKVSEVSLCVELSSSIIFLVTVIEMIYALRTVM